MVSITRRGLLTLPILAPFASVILAGVNDGSDKEAEKEAQAARVRIQNNHFPNVTLVTHEGKQVRFYDDLIKGKIVMINVMYASCEGVCPGITANLVRVQKLLGDRVGKDVFMYSITLKPEQDSPQALREYMDMHGIGPGWTYLTGKLADIELLRRKLGFTNPNPETDKDTSQHIGNVRYGNEPLMLWAACPGLASPKWIIQSLLWVIRPEAGSKAQALERF
jgi:protein SCO1/2